MNVWEKIIQSTDELPAAASELIQWSNGEKIFCLNASMGAGKTTFIKSLCRYLNYEEVVSSPTYPIINIYQTPEIKIYHIDCYRLKDADEGIHIGLEDCFYSNDYCFIEWADVVKKILPLIKIEINIEILSETSRRITALKISK